MALYNCDLLDDVGVTQPLESDNDVALLEAGRVLARSPCNSAEVWDGDRRVSIRPF
jgi:hypothetical protein